MAGCWLAMMGVHHVLGITVVNMDQMNRILAADAVVGGALALLIGAWVQRDIRERQLAATAATAQAKALQAQINPHFFFNTLNTVQSLMDTDAVQAKAVIGRLSAMFRYTLKASEQGNVPIGEELALVEHYLAIESARFGPRLRYTLPVVKEDFRVPVLILQPLVENAVRHGVAKRIDGGEVCLRVGVENGALGVIVENDADPAAPLLQEKLYQTGHALENIRQRLALLYNGRASLNITQSGERVTAKLVLPR
jgi:LytS/YehU family sensor histidine kinase